MCAWSLPSCETRLRPIRAGKRLESMHGVIKARMAITVVVLAAVVWRSDAPLASGIADDAVEAVDIERAVRQVADDDRPLWPGFQPLTIPLAVFDGTRTFLFRHPNPPEGFHSLATLDQAYVLDGRHDAVVANSSVELNGVLTATLMLENESRSDDAASLAATAIHETFHVFQHDHYPSWPANEADLFMYPSEQNDLLVLRRLENEALRLAMGQDGQRCWARTALDLRGQRYRQMTPSAVNYERHSELNEGLATYVQRRALDQHTFLEGPDRFDVNGLTRGFAPAAIRHRSYATGSALAMVLDQVQPGWQLGFGAASRQYLDVELKHALGPGRLCEFSAAQWSDARRQAQLDIDALIASRQLSLSRFLAQPGWRVSVETEGPRVLWPSGFDPLNVERVADDRILHTRFIRLSNASGSVDVVGGEALTVSAGEHPLFAGVQQIIVGGLPQPVLTEQAGRLTLVSGPLTIDLADAEASVVGQSVTIRLD